MQHQSVIMKITKCERLPGIEVRYHKNINKVITTMAVAEQYGK